jgi:penicillin amidase
MFFLFNQGWIPVSKRVRTLLGIVASLLVISIALILFARYEIVKSNPQTEGSIAIPGLLGKVMVDRDAFGVPRITASTEHDLYVAVGFVQGQDRLWQMDMARRIGMGRLSELFGEATVPFDRMFRIIGLRRTAEAIERKLSPELRDHLQWYSDGVNACISLSKGKYPVEFDMLRYEPEPWTPLHTLIVGRLLFWELNLSWWTDLTYGGIARRLGVEKAKSLVPGWDASSKPMVSETEWRLYSELRSGYLKTAQAYAQASGRVALQGGSNAWVVGPAKSERHGVLLANDTHLRLQAPSQWYEMEYQSPGVHAGGMTIPGAPVVVAGRNDLIAWGVTNVMADDADFYLERLDSTDQSKYLYGGQWYPLTVVRESLYVKGKSDPVMVDVRSTKHGPIVTDIVTPLQHAKPEFVASMRWTGSDPDDQFHALELINRAGSWNQFVAALKEYPGPGQNFVYGDAEGNIGHYAAMKLPDRGSAAGVFPGEGWNPQDEWKGFVPFERLPHRFNPPEGYIASANNKLTDDSYPYHISDLWEPSARIERLRSVLDPDSAKFTAEDFRRLQVDQYSSFAKTIVPYILAACKDTAGQDRQRVREYLRNWNHTFSTEDIATSIYQQFMVSFLRNTFADELGDDLYHDWAMLVNVPLRVISREIEHDSSAWFDDVRTPGVESRDDIIRRSLDEALGELRGRAGDDMKLWRWGDLHTVTLQHPFGLQKPLDKVFNIGPFPFPGGSTALTSGEFNLTEPFAVSVGPSFRQVFDLGSDEVRSILPTGESGQALAPHYSDQTEYWLHGGLRLRRWGALPERVSHLVLESGR